MDKKLQAGIEQTLSEKFNRKVVVTTWSSIGGGCINNALKIDTSAGRFFMKHNDAKRYPGMFEAEAKGLQVLKTANEIFIPEAACFGNSGQEGFLILEFVESSSRRKDFFEDFGIRLAWLHRHSTEKFGLDHDNYIGSLPQRNRQHTAWAEFFIVERMETQIRLARDNRAVGNSIVQQFEKMFNRLQEIFPVEKPSLLHGDLWNGNYMTAPDGSACLIDPAVYYGFREMDIAMSKLFGGFSPGFYSGYHAEFPLEKGWEGRIDICNLYPLMVHVNLFGGGYLHDVQNILKRF